MIDGLPVPSMQGFTIFGIDVRIAKHDRHVEVVLDMRVHDKRTPGVLEVAPLLPGRVAFRKVIGVVDIVFARDPEFFQHHVRDLVHEAVVHEVDEWLTFDGVQFTDPHANDHPVHR